jgi:hypothetical protein
MENSQKFIDASHYAPDLLVLPQDRFPTPVLLGVGEKGDCCRRTAAVFECCDSVRILEL